MQEKVIGSSCHVQYRTISCLDKFQLLAERSIMYNPDRFFLEEMLYKCLYHPPCTVGPNPYDDTLRYQVLMRMSRFLAPAIIFRGGGYTGKTSLAS